MAEILPFRGVRYAATRGRALGELLAPPYDLVSLEQRDELLRRSPHNIIHLTLGEDRVGDGPTANKYVRAGDAWQSWLAQGILKRDTTPSLYPLEQSFWAPDGRNLKRRGVMAAVRLHEFNEGIIVPHEKTLVAPKADRLELIKAVKANLSPIFGLYRDDAGATARALDDACTREPAAEATSDDGVHHRLWRCEDPAAIAALRNLVAPSRIFIADGHHRYETALVYRRLLEEQHPGQLPADGGHHYILMFLCPMSDPGLFLFATHRLLYGLKDFSVAAFLDRLAPWFSVDTLAEDVRRPAGRAWAIAKLGEHAGKSTAFLVVTAEDRRARVVTLRDDVDLSDAGLPKNQTLAALDVTVLHSLVLQRVLGLSPQTQEKQENVTYVRDAGEAVSRVLSGEHQVGFLVNPTPMWQVEAVGDAGETMPQKSTLFYPRLQSGLVMRDVNPLERP